jgi:hypothetical protein
MQLHLAAMDGRDESDLMISQLESRLADTRERLLELAQEASDAWTVFSEAIDSASAELAAGEQLLEDRLDERRAHGTHRQESGRAPTAPSAAP